MHWLLLLLSAFLGQTWGYSYLMVSHTASKSHHTVGFALAKGLAAAGHEVTLISPFPQKKPVKNLIDVDTPNIITVMGGESKPFIRFVSRSGTYCLSPGTSFTSYDKIHM